MASATRSTRASAVTPDSRARSSPRRAALAACAPALTPAPRVPHQALTHLQRRHASRRAGRDITSLDPWTASDPATLTVLRQVYETLVDLEPGGFRVVPASPSGGPCRPMDACGSSAASGRPLPRRHGARRRGGGVQLRARARVRALRPRHLVTSVVTPDPATVMFNLRTPFAPFLATLATPRSASCRRVLRRVRAGHAVHALRRGHRAVPRGAGAWLPGDRITLSRNASYWGGRGRKGAAVPRWPRVPPLPRRERARR